MDFSLNCTITTTLPGFSSCECPVSEEYKSDDDYFNSFFKATFHANGNCPENEGHVSIIFYFIYEDFAGSSGKSLTFSCTASVIDASGYKRFPQSFAFRHEFGSEDGPLDGSVGFGFNRYLRRSCLLNDSSELLPNDSLTLFLEIDFRYADEFKSTSSKYDTDGTRLEDGNWYLHMDTEFAEDLCKMSRVFQRMMESPMVEKRTGKVLVQEEEVLIFTLIYQILDKIYVTLTLPRICDIYVVADKYDMQPIIKLCHQLLTSVMSEITNQKKLNYIDKDIHVLSEMADRFDDDECLRDILTIYSDIKNELEGGTDGERVSSIAYKLETEWRCLLVEIGDHKNYMLSLDKYRANV